jgi:hypothetical protein
MGWPRFQPGIGTLTIAALYGTAWLAIATHTAARGAATIIPARFRRAINRSDESRRRAEGREQGGTDPIESESTEHGAAVLIVSLTFILAIVVGILGR